MKNRIIRNNVVFDSIEKISKKEVYVVSEDKSVKIRWRKFTDFEIICCECGSKILIRSMNYRFVEKEYLCKSCNCKGSRNPMYGKIFSEEKRKQMSIRNSGENNYFYGKTHSQSTKDKISAKNKGKLSGNKNPMFGVNVYDRIREKYGKNAEEKISNMKLKISKANSGENNAFYGKHHSEESRSKISIALKTSENHKKITSSSEYRQRISKSLKNSEKLKKSRQSEEYRQKKRIQWSNCAKLGKNPKVSFNPKACKVFDKIMKDFNIYIQHAMNDGEFLVEELGYWLDGYDKKNNTVYEYDEKHHFVGGKLRENDIKRQNEIEKLLQCKFIRLKDEDYIDI